MNFLQAFTACCACSRRSHDEQERDASWPRTAEDSERLLEEDDDALSLHSVARERLQRPPTQSVWARLFGRRKRVKLAATTQDDDRQTSAFDGGEPSNADDIQPARVDVEDTAQMDASLREEEERLAIEEERLIAKAQRKAARRARRLEEAQRRERLESLDDNATEEFGEYTTDIIIDPNQFRAVESEDGQQDTSEHDNTIDRQYMFPQRKARRSTNGNSKSSTTSSNSNSHSHTSSSSSFGPVHSADTSQETIK